MKYYKYKMRAFFRPFTIFAILLPIYSAGQTSGIGIYGTDIYSGGDVALHSSLTSSGSAYWHNQGNVYMRNGASITNKSDDTLFAGSGELKFISEIPQYMAGNPISASKLMVQNPSGLRLDTDLSIFTQAILDEGIINTGSNTLYIKNASADALVADMSQYSTRFIQGRLSRLTNSGDAQIFPVGDATSVHPLDITNNGETGYFTAEYISEYPALAECFPSLYYYGYTFNSFLGDGVWNVTTGGSTAFGMDAYHYSPVGYDAQRDQYTLGYNPDGQCGGWVLADNPDFTASSVSNVFDDYIHGSKLRNSGFYAILSALKNELDIVNLIRLDDGSETRFVIPNVWEYADNSLNIFSRWGTKVYETRKYDNSYDFKSAQAGSYFYVFNYTATDGKKHEVKSFVEVVK